MQAYCFFVQNTPGYFRIASTGSSWAAEYEVKDGDAVSPELTLLAGWAFGDDVIGTTGVLTNEYTIGGRPFVLDDPDQRARQA